MNLILEKIVSIILMGMVIGSGYLVTFSLASHQKPDIFNVVGTLAVGIIISIITVLRDEENEV